MDKEKVSKILRVIVNILECIIAALAGAAAHAML